MPADPRWFDNPVLHLADVFPLPLATETNWVDEGFEVNIIVVDEVVENGYAAPAAIFSRTYPYDAVTDADEARQRMCFEFAERLGALLRAEAD